MIDFKKLKEAVIEIVGENASKENLQKLGVIQNEIDNAEKERDTLRKDNDEIRKLYVDAIKQVGSSKNVEEKPDNPKEEKSFEEFLIEASKKD
jgi:hypothetical protein